MCPHGLCEHREITALKRNVSIRETPSVKTTLEYSTDTPETRVCTHAVAKRKLHIQQTLTSVPNCRSLQIFWKISLLIVIIVGHEHMPVCTLSSINHFQSVIFRRHTSWVLGAYVLRNYICLYYP